MSTNASMYGVSMSRPDLAPMAQRLKQSRLGRKSGKIRTTTVQIEELNGTKVAYVCRSAAARMVGVASATIHRMAARGDIPGTIVDADGVTRYPVAALENIRQNIKTINKTTTTISAPFDPERLSGGLSARVFRLFELGQSPIQIVTELEVEPATVRRLHSEWSQMRGMLTLDPSQYQEMLSVLAAFDAIAHVENVAAGNSILVEDLLASMRALSLKVVKRDALNCEVCVSLAEASPKRAVRCRVHGRFSVNQKG